MTDRPVPPPVSSAAPEAGVEAAADHPIVGLLHPGAMGSAIGAALVRSRHRPPMWVAQGRSAATRDRADAAGLDPVATLEELVETCEVVLSVCPPDRATEVAEEVAAAGFSGCYVDANAVSPDTARNIATLFPRTVDGGIVGPPPTRPGLTRLYLSGPEAAAIANLFAGTDVEARTVDGGAGAASAVKMCFAAWTKGTSALLLAIRALAAHENVADSLLAEWATSMPDMAARSSAVAAGTGPKAWRFAGEMDEIAATFAAAGLPDGFHQAASELYGRMAPLKDSEAPSLDEALALLQMTTGGQKPKT